jgi:hypothetical protein
VVPCIYKCRYAKEGDQQSQQKASVAKSESDSPAACMFGLMMSQGGGRRAREKVGAGEACCSPRRVPGRLSADVRQKASAARRSGGGQEHETHSRLLVWQRAWIVICEGPRMGWERKSRSYAPLGLDEA